MGFTEATRTGIRKWVTFSGRANRAEYWWFMLAWFLAMIPAYLFVIGGAVLLAQGGALMILGVLLLIAGGAGLLLMSIASIAALWRRLHDRNFSGLWYLGLLLFSVVQAGAAAISPILSLVLTLAYLAASIWLFVILCQRGTKGPNRFGDDPNGPVVEEVFA